MIATEALAHRGLVDAGRIADIRSGTGHLDVANDLLSLASILKPSWSKIASKTAIELCEVERAELLSTELIIALGARLQPNGEAPTVTQAADRRTRAFTLFLNAYDACRRVASYLRWNEDDVDQLVPSIFLKARSRRVAEAKPEGTGEGAVVATGATTATSTASTTKPA